MFTLFGCSRALNAILGNFGTLILESGGILHAPQPIMYNNKILVSDGKFSLGKNDKFNILELAVPTKIRSHKPTVTHGLPHKDLAWKRTITHEEEKIALIHSLASGFAIRYMFQ